ncbi:MAG: hypothetical protein ACR2QJ_05315 [Geminicoccaceae bacterium]
MALAVLANCLLPVSSAKAQCSAEDISSYMQSGASAGQLSQLCGNSAGGQSNTGGQRYVIVNGARLGPAEIGRLEQMACAPIPNGSYWLNMANGIWGYAGDNRPQGRLGDQC